MKLFKKLLAVTLVAVLALTVFTACGDSSEIPSSTAEQKIMQDLNDGAQDYQEAVLPVLYYSADLSSYTTSKLDLYIKYLGRNGGSFKNDTEKKEYEDAIKALEDKCKAELKYEVSSYGDVACALVKNSTPTKADYKSALYSNSNTYMAASRVGIARVEDKIANGGDGKVYTMVECYKSLN